MGRRLLLCGLMAGAFVLTFAFLSWHDGLWRRGAAPVTRVAPQAPKDSLASNGATDVNPLGPPSQATSTQAAVTAPAAAPIAPPEPAQSEPPRREPNSTRDLDNGEALARGDRGAERGARSR